MVDSAEETKLILDRIGREPRRQFSSLHFDKQNAFLLSNYRSEMFLNIVPAPFIKLCYILERVRCS